MSNHDQTTPPEAEDLDGMDRLFQAALYRQHCPSADDLLLYQAGLLDDATQNNIATHATTCLRCQAELVELEAATAAPAAPVSPWLWQRSSTMFPALLLSAPASSEFCRELPLEQRLCLHPSK